MLILRQAFRLTVPIMAAYWLIGLGYGIYATELGLSWWVPLITAACVYSGSAEFILASMLLGAFRPLDAVLMAVLVGARHLFYGISMLDRFKGAGWRKFFMIFMLSDETFAVTFANRPPKGVDPHRFQMVASVMVWSYWLTGATMGVALARLLKDVDMRGIEFIMAAMFSAIFAENWRREERHAGSLIGVGVSLTALLVLGPQNFMLPAMGGILVVLAVLRGRLA